MIIAAGSPAEQDPAYDQLGFSLSGDSASGLSVSIRSWTSYPTAVIRNYCGRTPLHFKIDDTKVGFMGLRRRLRRVRIASCAAFAVLIAALVRWRLGL